MLNLNPTELKIKKQFDKRKDQDTQVAFLKFEGVVSPAGLWEFFKESKKENYFTVYNDKDVPVIKEFDSISFGGETIKDIVKIDCDGVNNFATIVSWGKLSLKKIENSASVDVSIKMKIESFEEYFDDDTILQLNIIFREETVQLELEETHSDVKQKCDNVPCEESRYSLNMQPVSVSSMRFD